MRTARSGWIVGMIWIVGMMMMVWLGGCGGAGGGGGGGDGGLGDGGLGDGGTLFVLADEAPQWKPVAADFPVVQEADIEFKHEVRSQATVNAGTVRGIYQYGNNISDDLFMGLWRAVDGLEDRAYKFHVELEFASPYGSDCMVGGGASVDTKAGLFAAEPATKVGPANGLDYVLTTFDHGQQSQPGPSMPVLGNLLNGLIECDPSGTRWGTTTLKTEQPISVTPSGGRLYLVIGGDSAFESPHEVLYLRARLVEAQ